MSIASNRARLNAPSRTLARLVAAALPLAAPGAMGGGLTIYAGGKVPRSE